MAFLRTLVIALIIHVRTDFYHQLKAIATLHLDGATERNQTV